MIKNFIQSSVFTIFLMLSVYGLFTIAMSKREHCRQVNSEYSDYRFCLGI